MFDLSRSDLVDRINQAMAAGALVLSIVFGTDAARRVLAGEATDLLNLIALGAKGLGLLLVAWLAVLIFMKWRRARHGEPADQQGVTGDSVRRACTISWIATFVVLATQTDRLFAANPPEVVADLTLALMLGLYGICYFVFDQLTDTPQ